MVKYSFNDLDLKKVINLGTADNLTELNKIRKINTGSVDFSGIKKINTVDFSGINKIDDLTDTKKIFKNIEIDELNNKIDDLNLSIKNQDQIKDYQDFLNKKFYSLDELKIEYNNKLNKLKDSQTITTKQKEILFDDIKTKLNKDLEDLNKSGIVTDLKNVKSKGEFNEFVKKHWKFIASATVGIVAVSTIIGIVRSEIDKINNTNYKITSITNYKNSSSKLLIQYTPLDSFSKLDTLYISHSNSTPIIDGFYNIDSILGPGSILIYHNSINKQGTFADMKVITTFSNQFNKTVNNIIEPLAEITGEAIGTTLEGVGSGVSSGFSALFKSLFGDFVWVFYIVIIIFILSSLSLSALYIKKNFL